MSRAIENRREISEANKLHNEITDGDGRLVITDYNDVFGLFYILENRLTGVYALNKDSHNGEIILARISNVKKELGAAFVKISEDTEAFLKLSNIPEKFLPVKQGDIIPVKIISDEQKGKRISVSALINKKNLPVGWEHKSAFNVIYKPANSLLTFINKRFSRNEIRKIITDSPEVYEMLIDDPSADIPYTIELYNDDKISLSNLFSLKTKLKEAVSPRVYLKSGGYLVINHTEALTVIDVNSGKNTPSKKTDKEDVILNLNTEAAEEIALQLKLRNISGMILVDFINMDSEEMKEVLIESMNEYIRSDKVKVNVIDITPLGIMEITRQKSDKPLSEVAPLLMV